MGCVIHICLAIGKVVFLDANDLTLFGMLKKTKKKKQGV